MTASSAPRLSLCLPDELRERLVSGPARRGALTGALLQCVLDATSLYGLPKPVRDELERDMRQRRYSDQRDYVLWLLVERYRQLSQIHPPPEAEAAR